MRFVKLSPMQKNGKISWLLRALSNAFMGSLCDSNRAPHERLRGLLESYWSSAFGAYRITYIYTLWTKKWSKTKKETGNGGIKNPSFDLVTPSPWPFVGALAALISMLGLVLYMHDHGLYVLLMGGVLVLFTMVGWWRDVIKESDDTKTYTLPVQLALNNGNGPFYYIRSYVFCGLLLGLFQRQPFLPPNLQVAFGLWGGSSFKSFWFSLF